jgi:predicted AAA+ superfamily ATPase
MSSIIRQLRTELLRVHAHPRGRICVLTGARQVGKSTLVRHAFADYALVDLDSPVERARWERLSPDDWIRQVPRAIVDEVQKLPVLLDTLKAAYDRSPDVRYLLLGSSQIRLLRGVRETLAGRVALHELYPFSLPELATVEVPGATPGESLLIALLRAERPQDLLRARMADIRPPSAADNRTRRAWGGFLTGGGMPATWAPEYSEDDRAAWLRDYVATYLQRDVADLARLERLEPFARAQQAAGLRVARPVNVSEIARLSGIAPPTARDYLHYLELSYQVVLLPAWYRNPEKRLSKSPKLHFLDPGVLRAVLGRRGLPDGFEVENAVVAEVVKQVRTAGLAVQLSWLRTADGREVDLLVEREDGFIAIEVKAAERVVPSDARHLRDLGELLDKPLLASLVVSHDDVWGELGPPATWKLSIPGLLA